MSRLVASLAEPLGFGMVLATIAMALSAGVYHDLGTTFLRPVLLAGGVSSLIAGTAAWLLLKRPHQPAPALAAGMLAGFLTVAIGTGLYASITLIPIAVLLIGPILSVPTAGLAVAYALLVKRLPSSSATAGS